MAFSTPYIEAITLLSNASATGSAFTVKGGTYVFAGEGTFSGGTLTLQVACANGTFVNFPSVSLTANGFVVCQLPANCSVKAALTGGTPSAMYATVTAVP